MSIWKTPDQKQEHNEEVLVEYTGVSGRPFYEFDDFVRRLPNLKRWAYVSDLIAQADNAERLQKAVDLVVDYLEQVATHAKSEEDNFAAQVIKRKIDEIKQLIKESQ